MTSEADYKCTTINKLLLLFPRTLSLSSSHFPAQEEQGHQKDTRIISPPLHQLGKERRVMSKVGKGVS